MRAPELWTLVALYTAVIGVYSLQNVKLVFPPVVRVGGQATLLCLYDLEGEALYSVKWYRGNQEFYRYTPRDSPPGRVFPFEGIIVDVAASNANQVTLKNIPLHLSGKVRCEVSAEAPFFTTKCIQDEFSVLEFPDSRPMMNVMNTSYREGEMLTANCTSQTSRSPPTLTFYINSRTVSRDRMMSWAGGAMLRTTLKTSDFSPRGELRLKCVASVMGLYNISSASVTLWLDQDTVSTGFKKSAQNGLMLKAVMLWMVSVRSVLFMDSLRYS